MGKILLCIPKFEPLDHQVISGLHKLGYQVDVIYDQSFPLDPNNRNPSFKLIRKLVRKIWNPNYYLHRKNKYWENQYDFFLCINGFSLEEGFIRNLQKVNPKIKCILYLWDSLNRYRFERLFHCFNKVYTFDPNDADIHHLNYYPLFWDNEHLDNSKSVVPIYDISFIGKLHSDRYEVLSRIREIANQNNLKSYIKIIITDKKNTFIEWINHLLFKVKHKNSRDFRYALVSGKIKDDMVSFQYIPGAIVQRITDESKCILDIELPDQSGLTNRSIQCLGSGKKLISTNKWISMDPYFKTNLNINIINRSDPSLDINFITQPIEKSDDNSIIINDLLTPNWLSHILKE